jgi:sec-independent protein translocase protein TatC
VPPREELATMSLLDHLDELRKRLLYSVVALAVTIGLSWVFVERIFDFLERPITPYLGEGDGAGQLVVLGVQDAFVLYFKVAALAGVFLAAPFLLYQLYAFIAPGLYKRERLWAVPFVFAGTLFFVAGGAFAYTVAFPLAVDFLVGIGNDQFDVMITGDRYLSFLMLVMLGLGAMFELPIVVFLLAVIGVVTPQTLLKKFRWAVLAIFVVAAIITPTPDVVNLLVFALPSIALYLVGVAAAWVVVGRREKRKKAAGGADAPTD